MTARTAARRTVTVASPIGARAELTAAADRLLGDLEARVYLARPCWLVRHTYGRAGLFVPVDYGRHPERLRTVGVAAVAELERLGLVSLGELTAAPVCYYRDRRDLDTGRTVSLTELGRQRLRRDHPRALELEAAALAAQAEDVTR